MYQKHVQQPCATAHDVLFTPRRRMQTSVLFCFSLVHHIQCCTRSPSAELRPSELRKLCRTGTYIAHMLYKITPYIRCHRTHTLYWIVAQIEIRGEHQNSIWGTMSLVVLHLQIRVHSQHPQRLMLHRRRLLGGLGAYSNSDDIISSVGRWQA